MPAAALKSALRPVYRTLIDLLPARWHVALNYARFHGKFPNLKNPQTLNEKIAWRKLYDRDARLPELVDKVRAKEIVAQTFGEKYIIPTLAVYNSAAEMDFTKPPLSNPPYVLKVNHGGNGAFNIFVKEIPANPDELRARLTKMLKVDYENLMEEWAYKPVPRKILVEQMVETPEGYLADYKFHVFKGKTFAIEYVIDRFNGYYINLYDRNWKLYDIDLYARRPPYKGELPPPPQLQELIAFAEALGKDFPYVRVDLYVINSQVKFGEMTFYPGGGLDLFEPAEWNVKFGQQWQQDWSQRR